MNDGATANLEPIEKMVGELGVGSVFGEPIREGGVTVVARAVASAGQQQHQAGQEGGDHD